jgi:hypothetical protein
MRWSCDREVRGAGLAKGARGRCAIYTGLLASIVVPQLAQVTDQLDPGETAGLTLSSAAKTVIRCDAVQDNATVSASVIVGWLADPLLASPLEPLPSGTLCWARGPTQTAEGDAVRFHREGH